jgi:glutamate-ammonia-ligase adenylyltransferase
MDDLIRLAESIDSDRAARLTSDFGPRPVAILLGTAFPPLLPQAGWQSDALAELALRGWRAPRRRAELPRLFQAALASTDLHDLAGRARVLRRLTWVEKARIALRELLPVELGGAEVETTARELSFLADSVLDHALAEAEREVTRRHGVALRGDGQRAAIAAFGMGKLGGLELNAGSDVDLLFVYDTDEGGSALSLHEHFTLVVRRAVELLETPSADGLVWRVDLRLRPEGSQGPIVNSADATERYYARWGRLWERAALLRARPAAGDPALGSLLEREIILPFVFRREIDPAVAEALVELVGRSRRELSPDPARDLKLGLGGIREAEFFVQTLQLVWGGREPSLRVQGTLPALARLRSRGLVTDGEVSAISESYALLRTLEHRVQWTSGVQTHLLPTGDELGHIARTLRVAEPDLLRALEQARETVHTLFSTLSPGPPRSVSLYEPVLAALSADPDELSRVTDATFQSQEMGEHLVALTRRADGLLGELTRERSPELARAVLDELGASSDPERALGTLRAFFGRFPAPEAYVSALASDRMALRRLVTAFASSAFIGEAVLARPELADVILFGAGAISNPGAAVEVETEAQAQMLSPDADTQEQRDALVSGLRIAKQRVLVEVATADLAGAIGTRQATRLLASLADEILRHAVSHVLEGQGGLAVMAMGKLGGREIGYGSDLDVIFIYDPERAPERDEAGAWFSRQAQKVIRLISEPHVAGPGYELDTRLRPSGSQGMLVTSLDAFRRYHGVSKDDLQDAPASVRPGSTGAAWERQALLRARFAAGDAELGARAMRVAERAAYDGGAVAAREIHQMRARMERELAHERDHRLDLKTGRGGLLDVEFAVQFLQMRHGSDRSVRTQDTGEALDGLAAGGYLEPLDYDAFREGYRFLRRLEQRIHILRGRGSSVIDTRAPDLRALARRMGYRDVPGSSGVDALLARYRDVTGSVRATYERVLAVGTASKPP